MKNIVVFLTAYVLLNVLLLLVIIFVNWDISSINPRSWSELGRITWIGVQLCVLIVSWAFLDLYNLKIKPDTEVENR